ncbi:hypothetical protein [Gottfriedia acidiceleris]|uniref:Uncharacterized protein n=1 Tax=Gottfriedia acidiceleris TaxID=371036 RepID=A0ABY4JQI8_9BACI|nr:hypothetical protein [Gottfriedia acidiceleris]UPM56104.1 hypothetical protein MY490_09830 [Gottfriedia acidiceleris]
MYRVKFYSANDFGGTSQLINAEKVLREFDTNKDIYNINEIIEFYNINQYIERGIYLKTWSRQDIKDFNSCSKFSIKLIVTFFKSISDENFGALYHQVDVNYTDDFWKLIEKYKVYKELSKVAFEELLKQSDVLWYELLRHKKVVEHFGAVIREQLLMEDSSAEIILDKYEVENQKSLFLPNEITTADKEVIINNYIKSQNPNPNYLNLIINIQSTGEFSISDRTRLYARKRAEEEQERLFDHASGISMETLVTFLPNQKEVVKQENNEHNWKVTYDLNWIENENDNNTLLNNFIYLFEFVDLQMRFLLVNKQQEMGVFEKHFMRSKKAYIKGFAFDQKDILSKLQMFAYNRELNKLGIRLEELIEWFFKEYLLLEFNISDFRIKMPSEKSLFIEKCRAVLPEMESVLKQFCLFVEDKEINHELLQMSSGHLRFSNIPSLHNIKYVYANGDEFNRITYYLFSDQCMLSYIERIGSKYKNFYELLINENVSVDDYGGYYDLDLEWLINHDFIKVNNEGYLKICDISKINILKDLYNNEVINYWRYPLELREKINDMNKVSLVKFENTLFSKPEQDYLNYYLNKSRFNNALDLRNMYSHGTQPTGENVHNINYMIFLRIFILIIIKINDDMCLKSSSV